MVNDMYAHWCRLSGRLGALFEQRPRLDIAARTLLAIFGGYGLAALTTASLSLALPMPKAQAVLTATLLSFSLYAAAVIWAFSAASAQRAWAVVLGLAVLPAVHLLLVGIFA